MRYLFLVILSVLSFGSISAEAAQSYRVVIGAGQTARVNEHGICRYVTNNGSSDIFVPTNTANEWSLFRSNKPAYVSLGYCYQCPTTGSIYPAQATCDSACTQTAACNVSCFNHYCYYGGTENTLAPMYPSPYCPISVEHCPGEGVPNLIAEPICPEGELYKQYYYGYYDDCSTYSCPLSGGSACDGNHQCTASQVCITLP